MIFGSVCSGIEAASTAWEPLGWKAAWFAEIEPFPSAVLAHHWPETPNLGDFTTIRDRIASWEVPAPEVLVGGTPCQAFSVAGLRQSMGDSRGQLTLEFVRLANGIDAARSLLGIPECIVVWENVPGVLNTPDNAFGCFLAGLAGEDDPLLPPRGGRWSNVGRVLGPSRAVAWRILDAQYFGVAQRRRRVFVVASAREEFDPTEVLFDLDGVRRDSPPRRETGKGFAAVAGTLAASGGGMERPAGNANELDFCVPVAPTIPSRSSAGGVMGTDFDLDGGLVQVYGGNRCSGPIDIAPALNASASASASGRLDFDSEAFAVVGFNARQDPDSWEDRTGPLDTDGGTQAVAVTGDVFHTLRAEGFDASEDGTGRGCGAVAVACFKGGQGSSAGGIGYSTETAPTLTSADSGSNRTPTAMVGAQVRRLTPTECERLQGFSDGHTRIPWRGKPAEDCPDGPRYKALGNSMAVPVMRWIGERIEKVVER